MMPRSFDEFTQAERLKKSRVSVSGWFDARPELLDQVAEARGAGWSLSSIHVWLRSEYEYPLKSVSSLRRLLDGQL